MSTDGSKFLVFTGESLAGLKLHGEGGPNPSVHSWQRNRFVELLFPGQQVGVSFCNKPCLEGRTWSRLGLAPASAVMLLVSCGL